MLNLNDIPVSGGNNEPLELIPDGTVARAYMTFDTTGDTTMAEFSTAKVFKQSQNTSAVWLPLVLTVVGGEYDKRKVWHKLFVHGDKLDENGVPMARKIGLETLRDMINSAYGLNQNDMTPEAQAKRNIPNIDVFDGIELCVAIGIEKSNDPQYPDRNKIKKFLSADQGNFLAAGAANGAPVGNPALTASMPAPVQQAMQAQSPAQTAESAGVVPAWANK